MNKTLWASMAILSLVISACGAQPAEPSISVDDIRLTADAAAFTILAETHAAIATDTLIPSTETPTSTLLPTDTATPSPTVDLTLVTPTLTPTSTPQSSSQEEERCNQPLLSWQGPSASLSISHDYSPQGKDDSVVVSLWVITDLGECGFLYDLSKGPVGQYSAAAFVNGAKNFKVFGGFRITEGSWKIVIRNDSILALGGCYPNC